MAALDISCPGWVIRTRPVMFEVVVIAPGVEVILPPWGRDVQGHAGFEINPGRKDVDMDSVFGFIVPDGGPDIAIRFKSRPGQALEAVQHVVDLRVGWFVLRRPGDHRGRAPVFESSESMTWPTSWGSRATLSRRCVPGPCDLSHLRGTPRRRVRTIRRRGI